MYNIFIWSALSLVGRLLTVFSRPVIPTVKRAWKCDLAASKVLNAWGQMPRSEGKRCSSNMRSFKAFLRWDRIKQKLVNKISWVVDPNGWCKTTAYVNGVFLLVSCLVTQLTEAHLKDLCMIGWSHYSGARSWTAIPTTEEWNGSVRAANTVFHSIRDHSPQVEAKALQLPAVFTLGKLFIWVLSYLYNRDINFTCLMLNEKMYVNIYTSIR